MKSAVIVPCLKAQLARKQLETHGLWDKTRKLQKHNGNSVLIPVNTADVALLSHHLHETEDLITVVQADLPPSKSELLVTPAQQLLTTIQQMLDRHDSLSSSQERLLSEVPSHWEKHGDLVLLPASAFMSAEWEVLGEELWLTVARCTRASRVARQSVVSSDGFRTPQVTLLLGENAIVQHVDNAIRYEYDLTRCMFSAGNISEKLRIAKFNCKGETVVDLYAGIGYFTLPYLVHAGASHVHACEWNPGAVAALRRNLELNHVETRCTVHPGDNGQLKLRGIADRINLGLIPSSEEGWPVACRALKPTGGFLHVHSNVNSQTAEGERHPVYQATEANVENVYQESPQPSVGRETVEETHQGRMQTISLQEGREEVFSGMQTTSLQGRSGEASSETVLQTDMFAVRDMSKLPSVSAEAEETSRLNSALISGNEGKQLGADTAERETLVQQDLHLYTDSSPDSARTQPCPEGIQQPCAGCSPCLSHQKEQPQTMHDSPLPKLRPESCSERDSQSQASKVSSNIPEQCEFITHRQMSCSKTAAWQKWGDHVCRRLKNLLEKEHGGSWCASVLHIEPVKSYAPHVHHIVLDIHCSPMDNSDTGVS